MGYSSFCKAGTSVMICESQKKASVKASQVQIFRFEELEAATGGFAGESLLGKGSHGCVYKGILDNGTAVAVKRPSCGARRRLQEGDLAAFENEIRILSRLDRNPRLVSLLGFTIDSKERLLVVEFMPNGTLHDLLHGGRDRERERERGGKERGERERERGGKLLIGWPMRVHIALQIARAVLDLHSIDPPVIHRDIKPANILIDGDWNARLGDFGLALTHNNSQSFPPPAGTLGYLDPEYTTPEMLSPKNDVFSFGILLLEIISGRNAIDVQYNPPGILDWAIPLIKSGKILAICDPKLPPPKNLLAIKEIAAVALRCVRSKSSKRPTMADVVADLTLISRKLPIPLFNIARRAKKSPIAATATATTSSQQKRVVNPRVSRVYAEVPPSPPKVVMGGRTFRVGCIEGSIAAQPCGVMNQDKMAVFAPDAAHRRQFEDSVTRRKALTQIAARGALDPRHVAAAVDWHAVARAGGRSNRRVNPRKSDSGSDLIKEFFENARTLPTPAYQRRSFDTSIEGIRNFRNLN